MSYTGPGRFGPAIVLATFLCCCGPRVASAADFTLRNNTGGTALRGDNFQTHNQNIVWTSGGLFRSGDYQDWPNGSDNVVVQRSTDGGKNWSTLYDTGVHRDSLKPPTIEADAAGNVYILYPNGGNTRFVKFSPSNNYASPAVVKDYSGASSASKFASAYDAGRNRLYHGTQWGRLLTYDTSGNVTRNQHLITDGGDSRPSYPHVMVDEFGVIHYAMTVADGGDTVPYTDIRYMKSLDGGQTWKAMDGTSVSTPTASAGGSSGATLINRPGEHDQSTWLANMHAKDGKVHFTYKNTATGRMSYVRFDETTGTQDIDRTTLQGSSYAINSEAASFASDTSNSTGALYVVGERSDGKRLQALVSYDNGQTWQDYAQSGWHGTIANPSLARSVTPDGKVIGGVALDDPSWAWVHYLELPTAQPTTTIAYWDGGGEFSDWDRAANWVGDAAPTFDNKLAVAIGSGSSTAKFDTMRIDAGRTVRALIFGTYADADVNLRLKNHINHGRTLTFESNVPGGSAEINVHHDATGNIDIGGGDGVGDIVLNDPLRVNHNGSGFLTISRPISGSHTVSKYGSGEFELTGNNSGFTGTLDIQEGKLALKGSGSENGQPDVHVASGGTLSLGSGFIGGTATIGNLTGAGRVDPQYNSGSGTRTLQVNQTTNGTFSGTLRDASSGGRVLALRKTGSARLSLSGINRFSGDLLVSDGTLSATGREGGLNPTGGGLGNPQTAGRHITVDSGATLIFGNHDILGNWSTRPVVKLNIAGTVTNNGDWVNSLGPVELSGGMLTAVGGYQHSGGLWAYMLNSGGTVTVSGTAASTISMGNARVGLRDLVAFDVADVTGDRGADLTIDAPLHDHPSFTGGLTKTGAGTLTLSGANNYSGGTTINGGTLLVNNTTGPGTGSGAVNVDGGRLGGTGRISGAVNVGSGGTLAPGASIESLATGPLALGDGSTLEWEFDSETLVADLLEANGDLDLTGTVTLELADEAVSRPLDMGTKFTLISYSGAWNGGIFAGYGDDSTFTLDSNLWRIDYNDTTAGLNGGSYGSLVTLAAVPEPSSIALLSTSLLLLAFYGWRMRR